jgi:hypothetical protein
LSYDSFNAGLSRLVIRFSKAGFILSRILKLIKPYPHGYWGFSSSAEVAGFEPALPLARHSHKWNLLVGVGVVPFTPIRCGTGANAIGLPVFINPHPKMTFPAILSEESRGFLSPGG